MISIWSLLRDRLGDLGGFFSGSKWHPWFSQSSKAFSQLCRSLPLHIITPPKKVQISRFDSKRSCHLFAMRNTMGNTDTTLLVDWCFQVCCNSGKQFLHVPSSTCSKKLFEKVWRVQTCLSFPNWWFSLNIYNFSRYNPPHFSGGDDIHPKPPNPWAVNSSGCHLWQAETMAPDSGANGCSSKAADHRLTAARPCDVGPGVMG